MDGVLRIVQGNQLCDLQLKSLRAKFVQGGRLQLSGGENCIHPISFLGGQILELTLEGNTCRMWLNGQAHLVQPGKNEMLNARERLWATLFFPELLRSGDRFPLRKETVLLGREEHCDLVLPSLQVSRKHAAIQFQGGVYWLQDENSANGVSVNQSYVYRQQLQAGDLISVLPYYFRFDGQGLVPVGGPEEEPDCTALQILTEETKHQRGTRQRYPLQWQNGGFKLVLVSKRRLQSLWLTALAEGNFWFSESGNPRDTSHKLVSFSAKDKKWYVSGENAVLLNEQHLPVDRTLLTEQQFWTIQGREEHCILIVEPNDVYSNTFRKYRVPPQTQLFIGRITQNDICYDTPYMTKVHACLTRTDKGWRIIDQNSTNGIYVNEKLVQSQELHLGDMVYIMGLCLVIGTDFFAINDQREEVSLHSNQLERIVPPPYQEQPAESMELAEPPYFNRSPRRREALNLPEISFEAPPVSLSMNRVPLLLRYGGILLTGNVMSMITAALFPILTQKYTEREKKEYEKRRVERYTIYLQQKQQQIRKEQQREQNLLNRNNPPLNQQLERAARRSGLWERRKTDDDFLNLRIGSGSYPILAKYDCPTQRFSLDDDPLELQMYALTQEKVYLQNVPIMASFAEEYVAGVLGDRTLAIAFVYRLILQMAIQYSFDEVKFVFLIEKEELEKLDFVRFLPHCWNDQRTSRLIATRVAEGCSLSEYLKGELEKAEDKQEPLNKILKHRPYYFIFAFSKQIFDSVEVLKEILQEECNKGFTILTIFDQMPKECEKIFQLSGRENRVQHLKQPECPDELFQLDPVDAAVAKSSIRALFNLKLKVISEQNSLPKMITFLDMFGVGRLEDLNPVQRWSENDPVKSLAAPVGVRTDGTLFELDLHEKYHGPHGLVAGMTGSGKSEFIITYILSMAVTYHPDEVSFVLIDYKGGGLTGAFEDESREIHLPHLVGTITNLDGASIYRSLVSIQSELVRRQNLFNEAKRLTNEGTMDIYSYQKLYRSGVVSQPLPHLFVISDEFAELKAQQPDFMDQLISAARIGRSLGIHLILATQKPSGVVNDQIWSNTKFRVCLRVQDRTDSMDMLKRPEAAELENTGRFYLQVGYNEYFAMGQSAWCGAEYIPHEHCTVSREKHISFVDITGQTILKVQKQSKKESSGIKQIVAIVKYLSDVAQRNQICPRKLWKDPLPAVLSLEQIVAQYPIPKADQVTALMGIIDDPVSQAQYPFCINLQQCQHLMVVGEAGSGKTTFLQTMLYSLVTHYSPEQVQFYIMDFSSHTMNAFGHMPHCGMVVTEDEEHAVARFFQMLHEWVIQRKRLFEEQEVSSYEAYIQLHPLPLLLVFIDNISALEAIQHGDYYVNLGEYLKESVGLGIRFVLTGGHVNDFTARTRRNVGGRVALQLKDRFDYTDVLTKRCTFVPSIVSGRGLCVYEERPLEYQTALCVDETQEQVRVQTIRQLAGELQERYRGMSGPSRLDVISETETYEEFCRDIPLGRIPIGYSVEDVKKIAIPFQQLYAISVYFGNPAGVEPVWKQFLFAARREQMQVWVVRRKQSSVFPAGQEACEDMHLLDCTEESLTMLWQMLVEEINQRKVLRNQCCAEHHWSVEQPNVMLRVASYLRRQTRPILVLLESFVDFCKTVDGAGLQLFPALFTGGRGYHYYFMAGFYPGDGAALNSEMLFQRYNPDQLCLLMGGQFDQQPLVRLQKEYASIWNCSAYNKCLLQYQGKIHPMVMPCGEVEEMHVDPDDLPLFL